MYGLFRQKPLGNVVHCKRAPYDLYVGRPSLLGNPYTHLAVSGTGAQFQVVTIQQAVDNFRSYARWRMESDDTFRALIRSCHGKTLACWGCNPCHAWVILELSSGIAENPACRP